MDEDMNRYKKKVKNLVTNEWEEVWDKDRINEDMKKGILFVSEGIDLIRSIEKEETKVEEKKLQKGELPPNVYATPSDEFPFESIVVDKKEQEKKSLEDYGAWLQEEQMKEAEELLRNKILIMEV